MSKTMSGLSLASLKGAGRALAKGSRSDEGTEIRPISRITSISCSRASGTEAKMHSPRGGLAPHSRGGYVGRCVRPMKGYPGATTFLKGPPRRHNDAPDLGIGGSLDRPGPCTFSPDASTC